MNIYSFLTATSYNKIKTMQRQAYGFRDQEFFKLISLAPFDPLL